jgi:CheY-like chemotaxis protein
MSREQLAGLFKPFAQADSSMARRFGGTGLGLAISQHLASMLGGSINVTSELGSGSCFTLRIATGELDARTMLHSVLLSESSLSKSAGQSSDGQLQSLAGLHVLLAEDGIDNQRLISLHLRRAGATVDIAENGRVAMEMALSASASKRSYDVIFMDMQMPEMDGYAATAQLRSRGYTRPIIALTAHAMSGDREKCLQAGCHDYLTKPINKNALITACAHWSRTREHASA